MLPVLFRFHLFGHEIPIFSYGMMLVAAFFACLKTGQWLGRRVGIAPEHFANAVLLALFTGLLGARLSHVLENIHDFTRPDLSVLQNLINALNVRAGGLTFYGGLLLATPCCILYARYHRIPILAGMDVVAPLVMIGLGLGRIGCFLNGCCYGEQSDLPWAVRFPYCSDVYLAQMSQGKLAPPPQLLTNLNGQWKLIAPGSSEMRTDPSLEQLAAQSKSLPVQPAQLYSALTAFLLAGLLIAYLTLPHVSGHVFAMMLMLEGFSRYVLELLRVEPPVWTPHLAGHAWHFSLSMILGLQMVAAGAMMWIAVAHGKTGLSTQPQNTATYS